MTRAVLIAIGLLWLAGLVAFVGARPVVEAHFPRAQPHPDGLHNLAAMVHGPDLRASSYEPAGHHHPAFLVDGRARPTATEKWASAPSDREPWVEIRWGGPRAVARVVVQHAGSVEHGAYTVRAYRVACLDGSIRGPAVEVRDNAAPIAEHALDCARADGVRVDLAPNAPGDVVRVYEIEVWGR